MVSICNILANLVSFVGSVFNAMRYGNVDFCIFRSNMSNCC